MKRVNREELRLRLEADKAAWAELKARLMQEEFIDDDGYPTECALKLVEEWHWTDSAGLFEFIKDIWHLRSWGWHEVDVSLLDEKDPDYDKDGGKLYLISTAGWSGNEQIISALKSNDMAWTMTWRQSRVGGHYVFKERE